MEPCFKVSSVGWMQTRLVALTCLVVLASVTACSSLGSDVRQSGALSRLVAQDFVHVLQQIDAVHPSTVVVQLERGRSRESVFHQRLAYELTRAGYRTQRVPEGAGDARLRSTVVKRQDENAELLLYEISLGPVSLRREYRVDATRRLVPVGTMYVKGVSINDISLDESLWRESRLRTDSMNPSSDDRSSAAANDASDHPLQAD